MVLMLNDMSLLDLKCCEAWNDKVPVGNMSLSVLLLWNFCGLLIPL